MCLGPSTATALSLTQNFRMNACGKILWFYSRPQDCAYLPGLTGLFQVGDALSSKRRGYAVSLRQLTHYLQEQASQHWGLCHPTPQPPVLQLSWAAETNDGVFKREHCILAPMYSVTATTAEDAKMRTLFPQLPKLQSPSPKALSGRMTKLLTWNLGGEYTGFSLCCNTRRQSLAKDNTRTHKLVPCICVCVHTYMYMNSARLLSCSSLGKPVPSELNVYNLLRSYQHETFLFPALIKNRSPKRNPFLMSILLAFWNHLLVMCVRRCSKAVISC